MINNLEISENFRKSSVDDYDKDFLVKEEAKRILESLQPITAPKVEPIAEPKVDSTILTANTKNLFVKKAYFSYLNTINPESLKIYENNIPEGEIKIPIDLFIKFNKYPITRDYFENADEINKYISSLSKNGGKTKKSKKSKTKKSKTKKSKKSKKSKTKKR